MCRLILLAAVPALFVACAAPQRDTLEPPPLSVEVESIDPWKEAALRVEEDRGEPTGRKAAVEVPVELRHYGDTRRFLAVQVAEWLTHDLPLPGDFIDLIQMIEEGQLVEMVPLGEHYILYGVGWSAPDEPFSHFDRDSGESVPLVGSLPEFENWQREISESIETLERRLREAREELRQTPGRQRTRRGELRHEISNLGKGIDNLLKKRKRAATFYDDPGRRRVMLERYARLERFAATFGEAPYDPRDSESRRKLKVRLLSFLRPEARDVLLEAARRYHERFGRHLPITSLVRTEQYQRHLSQTNRNATRIAVPPHTTGLAFDIFDFFMAAAEQEYLMSVIAELKAEGRVEALRENRNHLHVFAFTEGRPPDPVLVDRSIALIAGGGLSRKVSARRNTASRRPPESGNSVPDAGTSPTGGSATN